MADVAWGGHWGVLCLGFRAKYLQFRDTYFDVPDVLSRISWATGVMVILFL